MASITIRQLDDDLKKRLKLQAARHGRSMEDEVRTILRDAAAAGGGHAPEPQSPASVRTTQVRTTQVAPKPGTQPAPAQRHILLIIGGGIAAYKSLDLIRRLKERGYALRCILTAAAQQFVTPLSVGALAGEPAFTDLFDPKSEFDAGHIRLARQPELIVVAPATADLMAKMAGGHADDLASAVLLATNRPVLLAPAMNPMMWANRATVRNVQQLIRDGVALVGPNEGEMAERGEWGSGRMAEPIEIVAAVAAAGADVVLVSGPVNVADPSGVTIIRIESAREMFDAVEKALPADCAIFAAAVADWRVAEPGREKIKKAKGATPAFALVENPDILATIAHRKRQRPKLVIGFAAETQNVIDNAKAKLARKGCDWIVANDVSPASGVMGGDRNTVHLVTHAGVESWPQQSKEEVALALVARIASTLVESAEVSEKAK